MRRSRTIRAALAAAALVLPAAASAQEKPDLPDPATVTAPDVAATPDAATVKNGYKYFFFYRADTDFAAAYADLQLCTQFTRNAGMQSVPGFVPWGEAHRRPIPKPGPSPYGLVGDIIGSMLAGPLMRGNCLNKMRRCMEPRGYTRYPISEDDWGKAHGDDERESLLIQAKLASGAKPSYAEAGQ